MRFLLFISCLFLFSGIQAQKFKSIFNHKDLTGWTVHGTEKWYVDQGDLVAESGPDKEYGYLTTDRNYKNFILELDFKEEANGNSGVFIRSTIQGTTINGWQVEIAPEGQHTGGIYESYGRGWLIQPNPEHEKALKPTEWNHMVIKVEGDEVTSWLNKKMMVSLRDEKIGKGEGMIALQIHSGGGIKIRFKNIRVRELK